jgi:hypothetical protein
MAGNGGSAGTLVSGTGGGSGDAGTAGTAGGGNLDAVAAELHGSTMRMPCRSNISLRGCLPVHVNTGCTANADPALSGGLSWDETVTIGGTPGTFYDISIRAHGLVEGKVYRNGVDRDASAGLPADGLYTGGEPNNAANSYNVYLVRTSSPAQSYFLNSIATTTDTRIRHSVFEIDFSFDVRVEGGSTVRLVVADPNCSAIKNCADPDVSSTCTPLELDSVDPLVAADIGTQPYNGQFVGLLVQSVRLAS